MGNKVKKKFEILVETLSSPQSIFYDFYLKIKNILLVSRFICQLFAFGHVHNVVSSLVNIVKLDIENDKVVSTLSNVVNINVEICYVDSTLFNVVNFNVDVHNIAPTLT